MYCLVSNQGICCS